MLCCWRYSVSVNWPTGLSKCLEFVQNQPGPQVSAPFERIDAEQPIADSENLSTDQKYLFDVHWWYILKRYCSPDLTHRNPGKMAHSRWLTTANRLLRLYISSVKPSENLMNFVSFIMKVYVPMWFYIKQSTSFVKGSQNVFKTIKLTRTLNDNIKVIVNPVIQRTAFFCKSRKYSSSNDSWRPQCHKRISVEVNQESKANKQGKSCEAFHDTCSPIWCYWLYQSN